MKGKLENLHRLLASRPTTTLLAFLFFLAALWFAGPLRTACVLFIAGLGIACWWLKSHRVTLKDNQKLCCLESLTLKPGSSIHLVTVEGKKLLIGCTSGQISLIERLDQQEGER